MQLPAIQEGGRKKRGGNLLEWPTGVVLYGGPVGSLGKEPAREQKKRGTEGEGGRGIFAGSIHPGDKLVWGKKYLKWRRVLVPLGSSGSGQEKLKR